MAYNPTLYNPYGQQVQVTMQPMQQPVNQYRSGIISVNSIEEAQNFPVPINSSSPPLFLANEDKFIVKMVDSANNVTIKHYRFEDVTPNPMNSYVTKDDFNAFVNEIREAINGKLTDKQSEEQTGQQPANDAGPSQELGIV